MSLLKTLGLPPPPSLAAGPKPSVGRGPSGGFVPKFSLGAASKRSIAQGERITIPVKFLNFADLPKGAVVDWNVSVSGPAIDAQVRGSGAEGTITVRGLAGGSAVMSLVVKVAGGSSAQAHKAPSTTFDVIPLTLAGFVPKLKLGTATQRSIAEGERITIPLQILNLADAPKGAIFHWRVRGSGGVIEAEIKQAGGAAVITVKGVGGGTAVMTAEVQVGPGDRGATVKAPAVTFAVVPLTPATFVPKIQLDTAAKRTLMVREKASIRLRILNWADLPVKTTADWAARVSGAAVVAEVKRKGGEGWIEVTAKTLGQAIMRVEVKVASGDRSTIYSAQETTFDVIPLATTADPSVSDEGGMASVTDLEQDMRNLLQDWKSAATDGVNQFVGSELSKRLDDLESGSGRTFAMALLGNTIWAAAAFTTGGAAFAISMAGIGVASAPTVPMQGKSAVPQIQKAMMDHIYAVHEQLDRTLRANAQALYDAYPRFARFRAIGLFVKGSFKSGLYKEDSGAKSMPMINMTAVRDLYAQKAKVAFDREVAKWSDGPLGHPDFQRSSDEAGAKFAVEKAKGELERSRKALEEARKKEAELRPHRHITKSDDGPLASPQMQWRYSDAELKSAEQKLKEAEKQLSDAEAKLRTVQAENEKARKEEREL
jgi:hypothetical protein